MVQTIKKLSLKYRIELIIFIFLCLRFQSIIPDPGRFTDGHTLFPYVVSYEKFGFGSRFLLGSIIQLFTDYVSLKLVYIIIFATTMLFICLVALLVGKTVRCTSPDNHLPLLAVIGLWACSPLSTQFFGLSTFGRMELFLQILSLVMIVCVSNRFTVWLIPILSVACIAMYQSFLFLYFVPLLVVLMFKIAVSKEKKDRINFIVVLTVTFVLVCVSFLLFQFGKNVMPDSPAAMLKIISEYSDINPGENPIYLEYFTDMREHFQIYILDLDGSYGYDALLARLILAGIFFSPIIVFFIWFYRSAVRYENSEKVKWIYRFAAISPLAALPAFVLTVDYGRWIAAIFFMQFALLLFFIHQKQNSSCTALNEIFSKTVRKYPLAYFIGLMCFISLGAISIGVIRIISIIIRATAKAFSMIGGL